MLLEMEFEFLLHVANVEFVAEGAIQLIDHHGLPTITTKFTISTETVAGSNLEILTFDAL